MRCSRVFAGGFDVQKRLKVFRGFLGNSKGSSSVLEDFLEYSGVSEGCFKVF